VAPASAGGLTVKQILDKVSPSVVSIEVQLRRGQAAGSGVIISDDGLVLTNAHVVNGATRLAVRFGDGSTRDADLVGAVATKDVALIRIREGAGLAAAALGSSAELSVGDDVIAIGNALDLGDAPTVTRGIVSAKDRSLDTGEAVLANLIQTDAAINHGNSGGPLLNTVGEVVGINTAGIENASNLGFAIEIDAIKPIIEQLRAGGQAPTATVAYLGVQSLNPDELDAQTANDLGIAAGTVGSVIYSVVPNSPAAQAGLRAGDLVVAADGKAVAGKDDVRAAIQAHQPGDTLTLQVVRDGRTITITATLGSRSSN
jgi:putative serine protease PepD